MSLAKLQHLHFFTKASYYSIYVRAKTFWPITLQQKLFTFLRCTIFRRFSELVISVETTTKFSPKGGAIIIPRIDIKRCKEEGGDLHAIFTQFHWRRRHRFKRSKKYNLTFSAKQTETAL